MGESDSNASLDILWGAEQISSAIGRTARQTYHLLESGELPARKVGGRWVASREKLTRFFQEAAL